MYIFKWQTLLNETVSSWLEGEDELFGYLSAYSVGGNFYRKMHAMNSQFTMSCVFFQRNHFKWLNVFIVVIRSANHLL